MGLSCIDTIAVILSDWCNTDAGQSEDPKKMPWFAYLYKSFLQIKVLQNAKTENNLGKSVLCAVPVTFA